jgi:hypothetical protein
VCRILHPVSGSVALSQDVLVIADASCGAAELQAVAEINGVVVSASPVIRVRDRKPVALPLRVPDGAPAGQLALRLVADGREVSAVTCVYAPAAAPALALVSPAAVLYMMPLLFLLAAAGALMAP